MPQIVTLDQYASTLSTSGVFVCVVARADGSGGRKKTTVGDIVKIMYASHMGQARRYIFFGGQGNRHSTN